MRKPWTPPPTSIPHSCVRRWPRWDRLRPDDQRSTTASGPVPNLISEGYDVMRRAAGQCATGLAGIDVVGLSKVYPGLHRPPAAIQDATYAVRDAELAARIAAAGCRKTTL